MGGEGKEHKLLVVADVTSPGHVAPCSGLCTICSSTDQVTASLADASFRENFWPRVTRKLCHLWTPVLLFNHTKPFHICWIFQSQSQAYPGCCWKLLVHGALAILSFQNLVISGFLNDSSVAISLYFCLNYRSCRTII